MTEIAIAEGHIIKVERAASGVDLRLERPHDPERQYRHVPLTPSEARLVAYALLTEAERGSQD